MPPRVAIISIILAPPAPPDELPGVPKLPRSVSLKTDKRGGRSPLQRKGHGGTKRKTREDDALKAGCQKKENHHLERKNERKREKEREREGKIHRTHGVVSVHSISMSILTM